MQIGAVDWFRQVYRVMRDYGELSESPIGRVKQLALHLFSGTGLTNISLGIAFSLTVTSVFGNTPGEAAVAGWGFFWAAFLLYVGAQEFIHAVRAMRREFGDTPPRGIH